MTDIETQMLAEVQAFWVNATVETNKYAHGNYRVMCDAPINGARYIISGNANCPFEACNWLTREQAIAAAHKHTVETKMRLIQVCEEIAEMQDAVNCCDGGIGKGGNDAEYRRVGDAYRRTLQTLFEKRKEIMRGVKPGINVEIKSAE